MARRPDPSARDRILDIACRLFTERGVHAVGLQQIIDECGCGKNLLYREFGSKDDLVIACLQRQRDQWASIIKDVAARTGDPGERLAGTVRAVAEGIAANGYRGCTIRNCYAEFPDPSHPVHQMVVAHYSGRLAHLRALAGEAGARDPDALAARITLLIDGLNAGGPDLETSGAVPAAVTWAEEAVRAAI